MAIFEKLCSFRGEPDLGMSAIFNRKIRTDFAVKRKKTHGGICSNQDIGAAKGKKFMSFHCALKRFRLSPELLFARDLDGTTHGNLM